MTNTVVITLHIINIFVSFGCRWFWFPSSLRLWSEFGYPTLMWGERKDEGRQVPGMRHPPAMEEEGLPERVFCAAILHARWGEVSVNGTFSLSSDNINTGPVALSNTDTDSQPLSVDRKTPWGWARSPVLPLLSLHMARAERAAVSWDAGDSWVPGGPLLHSTPGEDVDAPCLPLAGSWHAVGVSQRLMKSARSGYKKIPCARSTEARHEAQAV